MSTKKSRLSLKENRIPIGRKKENIDKAKALKKSDVLELVGSCQESLKKKSKSNIPLLTININAAPTDTSLNRPVKKPRAKLSTINEIKELEENAMKSENIVKTKLKKNKTSNKDSLSLTKTKKNSKEKPTILNLQNTIDNMNQKPLEIVLSPFVCTTRGKKWRPSPQKPPKLSELFNKYEDDNIADTYRKNLDLKTVELQNKVKYWTELFSENERDIPQTAKDEMDVVCGQTKLLTTDKFMQMRSLIEEFDNKSGTMPVTITDLDGFWDMLLLQVKKLEDQFNQLKILKENNWNQLQPIAKKIINKKISKVNKYPEVKSKLADFLKNKKKELIVTNKNENSVEKNDSNRFHEIKSNDNCIISSTPTSSNKKNSVSYTPMLLKTMELSYVARRSGMTPLVLAKPCVSPLKPALKNNEQKCIKRKNIHFESHNTIPDKFITPENSLNENPNRLDIQNRVATPHHTIKMSKVNKIKTNETKQIETKSKIPVMEKVVVPVIQINNECTVRRSSRLANKPFKNYKY